MSKIELISYKDFGKLRLQSFLPPDHKVTRDERGREGGALGNSGGESSIGVDFTWPENHPDEVGQIALYFRENTEGDCSLEIAQMIISAIGLPLKPKMAKNEIFNFLGHPNHVEDWPTGLSSLTFHCVGSIGATYELCCFVHPENGLCGIDIVRADLCQD